MLRNHRLISSSILSWDFTKNQNTKFPMIFSWFFRGWKMMVGSKGRGRVELKIMIFFFKTRFLPEMPVKSFRGCEKWILQKILHRSSDPKKIDNFFSSKNIFETYFSKFSKYFFFDEKKKLWNFLDNYIDVKFSEEFIFRILGTIWQAFPGEILS